MAELSRFRHFGGFVLAGSAAFVTDVVVFQALAVGLSTPPLLARSVSIPIAMVVSWLINRTITFAMAGPPRLSEFLKFASVASISSLINYAVFAAILQWAPGRNLAAIVAATAIAMLASYAGMRLGVFRRSSL